MKAWLGLLTAALLACATVADAQTISVPTNGDNKDIDHFVAIDVRPGDTVAEMPFTVRTVDEHYTFGGMARLNGLALSIISPAGTAFVPSSDNRIKFLPGAFSDFLGNKTQDTSMPGGTFTVENVVPNTMGTWKLRFTFLAAPEQTQIGVFYGSDSAYRIGLWTNLPPSGPADGARTVAAGGTAKIWVFATQGRDPVKLHTLPLKQAMRVEKGPVVVNSNPQVTIKPPSGATATANIPVRDDGMEPDGKAGDGLYAGSYQFGAPGSYLLEASVTLQTPNGPVTRSIQQGIQVTEPPDTPRTQAAP